MHVKVKAAIWVAGIITSICAVSAFFVSPNCADIVVNLAVLSCAAACGWVIGIIASPYDKHEERRFSEVTRALSVFGSGYLAAKLDGIANTIFSPEVLGNTTSVFRLLSFISVLLVGVSVTFVVRKYYLLPTPTATESTVIKGASRSEKDIVVPLRIQIDTVMLPHLVDGNAKTGRLGAGQG